MDEQIGSMFLRNLEEACRSDIEKCDRSALTAVPAIKLLSMIDKIRNMEMETQQDRVSYSYGIKLSDGHYGSRDAHVSYSSDVKEGETKEQAMARVKTFVEQEAKKAGSDMYLKIKGVSQ